MVLCMLQLLFNVIKIMNLQGRKSPSSVLLNSYLQMETPFDFVDAKKSSN